MLHDTHDDGTTQSTGYQPPRISEIGSLRELTLAFNKKGPNADIFSQAIPIVGSITSLH